MGLRMYKPMTSPGPHRDFAWGWMCLDVSLQTRQLAGHAWSFRDEANLNCQKQSREMQTLLTSDSHYTKVCKICMLGIGKCLVPRDSVQHTPQIPQTLGVEARLVSVIH